MTKKEVLNKYYELLNPFLKKEGYKLSKKDQSFFRKTEYGFDRIYIAIITYKYLKEHSIYFLFKNRHDEVQNLTNKAFQLIEEYQSKSTSTNVHIKTLVNDDMYEVKVRTEEDIIKEVEKFKSIYISLVDKHFKEFSKIENILKVYQETPHLADKYCGPNSWYFYYLTITFLLNEINFIEFRKKIYKDIISLNTNKIIVDQFNEYADSLEKSI